MSEMSCKTCGRWAAGWCLAQQLGTSRDEVCNAWELSRVVEWEDENEKLKSRIAKLEAAQRWIPVSEPPKVSGKYLLLNIYDDVYPCDFIAGTEIWVLPDYDTITHWMPLPKLPEVQE